MPAASARSPLREERHPNSVTAPPINRGSMAPRPWRGFWNSLGTAVLLRLTGSAAAGAPPPAPLAPWQHAAKRRRAVLVAADRAEHRAGHHAVCRHAARLRQRLAGIRPDRAVRPAVGLGRDRFHDRADGLLRHPARRQARAVGTQRGRHHALDADARTAIIMPICNEDVRTVFAGLRATCESVAATGHAGAFDVFVLSDSNDPATAAGRTRRLGRPAHRSWPRRPASR